MSRLYVVPTPIGNLEDITLRALRVLRDVTLILAEDTRHTRKLLSHFEISTPMQSYHQHNKRVRLDSALSAIESGDVALVSSAGMPSISDPGFELIQAALERQIEVDVLPGPSAVVTAVVAAAIPSPGFLFVGFLPRHGHERRARLEQLAQLGYSLVLYESPHRLAATLADILSVLGDRQMAAARELTKLHQEVIRGRVSELLARTSDEGSRGEYTLVIAGAEVTAIDRTDEARVELLRLRREGQDTKSVVEPVAARFGMSRNDVYRLWIEVGRDAG